MELSGLLNRTLSFVPLGPTFGQMNSMTYFFARIGHTSQTHGGGILHTGYMVALTPTHILTYPQAPHI